MKSYFKNQKNGFEWIVDEKPFLALAGEVHNSSASSIAHMEPLWGKLSNLGLNTVVLPVYWELSEPFPGIYDFSLVDEWLKSARKHNLKLIILWFGTWKNSHSSYVPAWIKMDKITYPRAKLASGVDSLTISPLSTACQKADSAAFSRLMAHLKNNDTEGTVIAVQVENESGLLGATRDFSKSAEKLFNDSVPKQLICFLQEHPDYLSSLLQSVFNPFGANWSEVFGKVADEAFMAWHTASYINEISKAGKAEYADIPYFVNAWTMQCPNEPAGIHPSGGPTAEMYAIWCAAAPHLDAIAPDLYLETFEEDFTLYSNLPNNPFILPETRNDRWASALSLYAFAEKSALCFSPFAIEEMGETVPLPQGTIVQGVFQTMLGSGDTGLFSDCYHLLADLTPLILSKKINGEVRGFIQNKLFNQAIELSDLTVVVNFNQFLDHATNPSGGIIVELGDNEYLFAGFGYSASFYPKNGIGNFEILSLEEGVWKNDSFLASRRLNGDELHLTFTEKLALYKVKLVLHK